jgi:hypothetical protein
MHSQLQLASPQEGRTKRWQLGSHPCDNHTTAAVMCQGAPPHIDGLYPGPVIVRIDAMPPAKEFQLHVYMEMVIDSQVQSERSGRPPREAEDEPERGRLGPALGRQSLLRRTSR